MKTKTNFSDYPAPKTSEQEVLLTLIVEGKVSIMDFPYLSGFRTRVSDLQIKRDLFLEREFKTGFNRFGNPYTYAIHILNESNKQKAIDLYLSLNSQKK